MRVPPLAAVLLLAARAASAQAPAELGIGIAPVVPDASTFLAIDEGYLKEAGFTPRLEKADSAATLVPFLASNRVQVVQGGLSLGYFNAVAQGLPMIIALDSSSTPVNSTIIVRAAIAGEFKVPADLKGKRVGIVAP